MACGNLHLSVVVISHNCTKNTSQQGGLQHRIYKFTNACSMLISLLKGHVTVHYLCDTINSCGDYALNFGIQICHFKTVLHNFKFPGKYVRGLII